MATYTVHQRVELINGRQATIRYVGNLHFTDGDWIGVEFDDASGKNDGSARGKRYFQCAPAHGMFLRSSMIAHAFAQQNDMSLKSRPPATQLAAGRQSSGAPNLAVSKVSAHSLVLVAYSGHKLAAVLNFLLPIVSSKVLYQQTLSASINN